jgi:hypothetical protein
LWWFGYQNDTQIYLGGDESTEVPIDPAADDDHGEDVGQVALQHVGHHRGVSHRVRGRSSSGLSQKKYFIQDFNIDQIVKKTLTCLWIMSLSF